MSLILSMKQHFLLKTRDSILKMTADKNKDNLTTMIYGCRQNDRYAQNQLYKMLYRYVFGVCTRYVKNEEEAKEVVQDIFYKIFTKIDKYGGELSFYSWIKKIAVNTCIDRYRSKIHDIPITDIEEANYSEQTASVIMDANTDYLLHFIQKLSPAYKVTFNMYAIDGYKYSEIAEILSISEGAVKSNVSRARMNLQKMIDDNQKIGE
jgi:RNA polymerase sigma factor (sigma-70 family)